MNTDKIYAEHIVNEYSKKDDSKVVALRKLDAKAKQTARIFSLSFGIISSLIAGTGMCLAMGEIGQELSFAFPAGVVVGLIGFAGMISNYFAYNKLLQKGKEKYGFEIMELAKDIASEEA